MAVTFTKYGNIDVSYYKKLFSIEDDWFNEFDKIRAKSYDSNIHTMTSVIPIQWSLENLSQHKNIPAPHTTFWDKYYYKPFFDDLASILGKGYSIRIIFAKLIGNGKIIAHVDTGESLLFNRRIHIPIVTNDKVLFGVGEDTKNIKEGEVVEINNSLQHWVSNKSSQDRIHMIVDWNDGSR